MEVRTAADVVPLPDDYYRRIFEVEQAHWWHRGMRAVSAALLGERLRRRDQRLLDVGCGTGGFIRWALDSGAFGAASGIDVGAEAIEMARLRVPEADLRVAAVQRLPFDDQSFDLVVINDVLQHVPEDDVHASLGELRRVLRPDGVLLLRTNGARRLRRERPDWRIYDRRSLRAELERAGFECRRVTYANVLGAVWAVARRATPRAPDETTHGIPTPASPVVNALGRRALGIEAGYLRHGRRTLPWGHTLVALATPERTEQDVAAFFDAEAKGYDAAYDARGIAGYRLRRRAEVVMERLGDGPGDVLDAGMGPGRLCAELERRSGTAGGVDASAEMVRLARERVPEAKARFTRAELERLPHPDASFDAVVATGVLEYVIDLPASLGEIRRVLRPGGRAVLSLPNRAALYSRWRRRMVYPAVRAAKRVLPFRRPAPPAGRPPLSREAFESLLAGAGLRVEHVDSVSFEPLLTPLESAFPRLAECLAQSLESIAKRQGSALATQLVFTVEG